VKEMTERSKEFIDFVEVEDVTILKTTEKAALCLIGNEEIWIPQSQIDDRSEIWLEDDEGTLTISGWIADQKKLRT